MCYSCVKDDFAYFDVIFEKVVKTIKSGEKQKQLSVVPVTHDQLPANCFTIEAL